MFYYFYLVMYEMMWEWLSGVEIVLDEMVVVKMVVEVKVKETKAKEARERAFAEARVDVDVMIDVLDVLKKYMFVDVVCVKLLGLKSWYYEDDLGNW